MITDLKQIGWQLIPLYQSIPGSIVTQAFILCCNCKSAISTTGGPRLYAYCMDCGNKITLNQNEIHTN